jgi:hypothetical protein
MRPEHSQAYRGKVPVRLVGGFQDFDEFGDVFSLGLLQEIDVLFLFGSEVEAQDEQSRDGDTNRATEEQPS